LRNAYSEWCARASWCQIVLGRREFLAVRQQRKITAEAQRTQRKARALTQRTPRKAENTEKDNGKPTATALQSQHCAPADTFQLAV
jgi:hypothetical protein